MSSLAESQQWLGHVALILVPSHECNLRCKHCFVEGQEHAGGQGMTADDFVALVQAAEGLGIGSLEITGGEFFAWPHHEDALRALAETSLPVAMSTNGTLLAPAHLAYLRDGAISLSISLDGPPELHDAVRGRGNFALVERAAALCVEHGVPFELSATVTRRSLPEVMATIEHAHRMGAQGIRFKPFQRLGGRSERLDDYQLDEEGGVELVARITQFRRHAPAGFTANTDNMGMRVSATMHPCSVFACWGEFCPAKKYWPARLAVMPDGEVLPQSPHVHPRYSLGNALAEGLEEVVKPYWRGPKHLEFQRLCRYIYQDLIYGAEASFYLWDSLAQEASARPPAELPQYDTVHHPYDHGPEIAALREAGLLDDPDAQFPRPPE